MRVVFRRTASLTRTRDDVVVIDSWRCANVFRSGPLTRKPTAAVEVVPVNTSAAGIRGASTLTACHICGRVVALTVGYICVVQLVPRAVCRCRN